MPNLVQNRLNIRAAPEVIKAIKTLIRQPARKYFEYKNLPIGWDGDWLERSKRELDLTFTSAWGPPYETLSQISKDFPNAFVYIFYAGEGPILGVDSIEGDSIVSTVYVNRHTAPFIVNAVLPGSSDIQKRQRKEMVAFLMDNLEEPSLFVQALPWAGAVALIGGIAYYKSHEARP